MDWNDTVNELKVELDYGKTLSLSEFAKLTQVAAAVLGEDAVVATEYSSARGSYTFQRRGWEQEKSRRTEERNERWAKEAAEKKAAK